LWAERYDQDIQDGCVIDDNIVIAIAARVAQQVEATGIAKARRKSPEQMTAYDWLMRGLEFCDRSGIDDAEPARLMFQKAIAIDPNLAQAYSGIGCTLVSGYWKDYYKAERSVPGLDGALEFATRAVELDPHDSSSHRYLAYVHLCRKSFELVRHHLDIAASLNPNDAESRGRFEMFTGRPDAGLESLERAGRLNPHPSNGYWELHGMTLYGLGRYENAMASFDRMTATPIWIDRFRAACFAQLGYIAEAKAWAREALRREPRFTLRRYATVEPYRSQTDLDHMIDGMRKAGLPE
jgi:tetratricopeptide (TPR) repeat protein